MSATAVIVGAGLMGRWHARAAARAGARVVAVVDPSAERADALARRHRACRSRATLAEALDDEPSAVVHVCAPLSAHAELVAEALQRGAHVLVEKPLAPTAAGTKTLLELAGLRGRLLCPVHQFLFQRGALETQRLMPSLGSVRHVDTVICSAGAESSSGAERNRIALEILPHPLSLLRRLLDWPVAETGWSVARAAAGELRLTGSANGASAAILVSMSGRPTRNTARFIAERGTVHLDLFHGFHVVETPTVSRGTKILRPLVVSARTFASATANLAGRVARAEPAYPGLDELVRRFYAAAAGGGDSPIGAAETLEIAMACDAIAASAGA